MSVETIARHDGAGAASLLAAAFADASPVSLSELEARAGLLERQDQKYLMPQASAAQLVAQLRPSFDALDIDGQRTFTYDSVYLDTPDLALYREHAQGRRLRWKVRTRRYGDGPLCFQEVKLKAARGATIKLRRRCAVTEHGWAGPDLLAFVDGALPEHYGERLRHRLVPSLSSDYARSTLVASGGGERLTFDRALRVIDSRGRRAGGLRKDLVLLEVKTGAGRSEVHRLLAARGVRPLSVSKYGVGVALTYDHVGHNRLRPVLKAGFESAAA